MPKRRFDHESWFGESRQEFFSERLYTYQDSPGKFLEVGSFEGRSAVWVLDNILKHPDSRLTCVDPCYEGYASNLRFNLSPYIAEGKCRLMEEHSESGLPRLLNEAAIAATSRVKFELGTYDFVYIDGCHHSEYVLRDAVMSFLLLKEGGIMAFDDYLWRGGEFRGTRLGVWNPQPAVDSFLAIHTGSVEVLDRGYQVWIRKTRDFPDLAEGVIN